MPPLGNNSEHTPSIVGQKYVLPMPYIVAAANACMGVEMLLRLNSPIAEKMDARHRRPIGEKRCASGPAKNRNTNMIPEV